MLINFNNMDEIEISNMNHGMGSLNAKMYKGHDGKIIPCSIHPGGSIGMHKHETSDDINYVISGQGIAICDGHDEILSAGVCHICKKGSSHSITNTGDENLVLLTIVVEK